MPRVLHTCGEYPTDWPAIADGVREDAGHRCIRCGHPYRPGGSAELSPCDARCTHGGPFLIDMDERAARKAKDNLGGLAGDLVKRGIPVAAYWRVLTVHHFDGDKANCAWWNLLALCQRCHLQIQARVNPQQPYMFEHSAWLKPYVAGFYAVKYRGLQLTRAEVELQLEQLLALERVA